MIRLCLEKNVVITMAILCTICFISSLCPLFGFGDMHFKFAIATCKFRTDGRTSVTDNVNYALLLILENLLIPWPILIITNSLIVRAVMTNLKKIYATGKDLGYSQEDLLNNLFKDNEKEKLKKQLNLIKVFGGTLVAHVFTSLPTNIYILQAFISGHEDFPPAETMILFICFISFPVVHPLMQACFIPEVRNIPMSVLSYSSSCCWSKLFNTSNHCHTENCQGNCLCKCNKLKQFLNLLCLATLSETHKE